MNYISHYDVHGKYTYVTIASADQVFPATGIYIGKAEIGKQYHDSETNKPVDIPERSTYAHVFNYATKKWELEESAAWGLVRTQRDSLLAKTDWRVTKALESGQAMDSEWILYRQALRDVTLQADPEHIEWPQEP